MNLPRHPGDDNDTDLGAGPRRQTVFVVGVVALLALLIVLHLTGVAGG